jgi:hypothetical protein
VTVRTRDFFFYESVDCWFMTYFANSAADFAFSLAESGW